MENESTPKQQNCARGGVDLELRSKLCHNSHTLQGFQMSLKMVLYRLFGEKALRTMLLSNSE